MISFTIDCDPPTATHHSKQIVHTGGFARLADRPNLVAARRELMALVSPYRPPSPVLGPIKLTVWFAFPHLKGTSARKRAKAGALDAPPMWKTTRPDLSNLVKTLEDVLVASGFMQDDGQVCSMVLVKVYSDKPGITVQIEGCNG